MVQQLGKIMRPQDIRFVGEPPKTRCAKLMPRLIRAKYLGLIQMGDTSSLREIGRSR